MKTFIKTTFAAAAFTLGLAASILSAQNEPPPPPPPGACPSGFCPNPQDDFLKMLIEKLALTQEQQTKIKAILDDEKQAVDDLFDNSANSPEAVHTKMGVIHKSHREQIRDLLSAEQQKLFDQLKPNDRPGPPPPPPGVPGTDEF